MLPLTAAIFNFTNVVLNCGLVVAQLYSSYDNEEKMTNITKIVIVCIVLLAAFLLPASSLAYKQGKSVVRHETKARNKNTKGSEGNGVK